MLEQSSTNGQREDNSKSTEESNIIDIRHDRQEVSLKEELLQSLHNIDTKRELPDLLLWNEEGLKAFEAITYSDDYYLTNEEISLLEKQSDDIAQCIQPNTMLIELGSGNLRKVKILLDALDHQAKPIDYYALDLDRAELSRTLSQISPKTFNHVRCHGLFGTYDDGQAWLSQNPTARNRAKVILSLGSTIGSFGREAAPKFLSGFLDSIIPQQLTNGGPQPATNGTSKSDTTPSPQPNFMLIAIDGCKDGNRVWRAYNSPENTSFITGGLRHANQILGYDAFRDSDWSIRGEWNAENGSHDQYYIPLTDVEIEGARFRKGEKVLAVRSHKYDEKDRKRLWREANVKELRRWRDGDVVAYGMYLIARQ